MVKLIIVPEYIFPALYHLANGLALLSLIMRDQLYLRLVMAVSLVLQGLYYFAIPGGPLMDPLLWKFFTSVTNIIMIILIFRDRLDFGVSSELRGLFSRISVLSPGEFKRLVAPTKKIHGPKNMILAQGEMPDQIFYLLKGHAHIMKDSQSIKISSGAFLGEIAFLTRNPATATVGLEDDAECLVWSHDALNHIMGKETPIDIAMRGLFNHDLARKVSQNSLNPTLTQPSASADNGL